MVWSVLVPFSLALAAPEPETALDRARAAERLGQPEAEHAACREAVDQTVSGWQRCEERLAWLELRRDADGGFGGLHHLETLRRGEPATDEDLAQFEHQAGLSPVVRGELRLWWAERAHDPKLRWQILQRAWEEREGLPWNLQDRLASRFAAATLAQGDPAGARTIEDQHLQAAAAHRGLEPGNPGALGSREGTLRDAREARRPTVRHLCRGALLISVLGLAPAALRFYRRRPRVLPLGLPFLAMIALVASGLGLAWDLDPRIPLGLGVGLATLHLLAAGALAEAPHPLRRICAASASSSLLWLVLDQGELLDLLPF